ncbi:TetR/AcrR family transcriptional regulator [Halorubrum sp. AJ67]|uniref:TetR/AcrR family transcriptional regulator n=1 Tax=Halorubrum sp. AJ67 TaxID=1173487 RepID=UPI0003DD68F9|nr:TetR/AcrR family transcriptional regulator [Halorubrum sp. AJ67]CDK40335.1 transcription regulator [Halorubrum sp. AJ67]
MTQFTNEDRKRLRRELIEAGHDYFTRFGFDRTRVSDVTSEVGIGTSTFYQFFDSKEALYLTVLLSERERLFETLESAMVAAETPREEAEMILRTTLGEVRTNPLIRRLFVGGEIRRLESQLDGATYEGDLTSEQFESPTTFKRVLQQPDEWVEHDEVWIDDPDVVRGLMRSVLFVTQARNTPIIPDDSYEAIEEALIETIVAGLFTTEENTDRSTTHD